MKKLITGAVAALALLFGFASCSGDLHENDVQPLTITGLCGTAVVPMELEKADGSLQKLTFKVAEDTKIKSLDPNTPEYALKDGWGALSDINFKIVPQSAINDKYEPDWIMDFGGPKDNVLYLSATKTESYTQLKSRAEFSSGYPSNIHIDGAVANEEYTIWVKYDAAAGSCSIWLSGASTNPTEMRLVATDSKNFPAKDDNGKELSYSMTKAGTTYTYQFVSVKDETISFHLTNDMAGTFGGTLGTDASKLMVNESTVTNMSLTVKNNVEYKITVEAKSIATPTIKYEVIDMLKDAKVNANWKYAENSYTEDLSSDSYQFTAERDELDLTVVRHDGGIWGKGEVESFNIDSDAVALKYSTAKEVEKTAPATIKVKGLKVGTCYKVVLEKDNNNFTLKAKVVTVPLDSYFETGDLVG